MKQLDNVQTKSGIDRFMTEVPTLVKKNVGTQLARRDTGSPEAFQVVHSETKNCER